MTTIAYRIPCRALLQIMAFCVSASFTQCPLSRSFLRWFLCQLSILWLLLFWFHITVMFSLHTIQLFVCNSPLKFDLSSSCCFFILFVHSVKLVQQPSQVLIQGQVVTVLTVSCLSDPRHAFSSTCISKPDSIRNLSKRFIHFDQSSALNLNFFGRFMMMPQIVQSTPPADRM